MSAEIVTVVYPGPDHPAADYLSAWMFVVIVPFSARVIAKGFVSSRPAARHRRATRRNGRMLARPTVNVQGDS
jgi:hypothetical protein